MSHKTLYLHNNGFERCQVGACANLMVCDWPLDKHVVSFKSTRPAYRGIQTTSLQSKINIDLSITHSMDINVDFEFTKQKFLNFRFETTILMVSANRCAVKIVASFSTFTVMQ